MKTLLIIVTLLVVILFVIYKTYFTEIDETKEEFTQAVLKNIESSQNEIKENIKKHRDRIGSFPANIKGKVSFTYHIGSDPGEDMVWLEEFGELEFFIYSNLYDEINIEEDKHYSFTVVEKEDNKVWIISGKAL